MAIKVGRWTGYWIGDPVADPNATPDIQSVAECDDMEEAASVASDMNSRLQLVRKDSRSFRAYTSSASFFDEGEEIAICAFNPDGRKA